MDDETILQEQLEQLFNDQFKVLLDKGYPPKMVVNAFINQSMMAFQHHLGSDPARIPNLLRRFAMTVESRLADRK